MSTVNQALEEMLDAPLKRKFVELAASPNLTRLMTPGMVDKRLYALYLLQTFHYTKHNAKHQAIVGTRLDVGIHYMKYTLKHALEETGHEMMAWHDLESLGFSFDMKKLPPPMKSTEKLNNYLYEVARNGNPLARLGYSYWAERSYDYIKPLFKIIELLGIKAKQMTFLDEHAVIDDVHAKEVAEAIIRFAKKQEDWTAIHETMIRSLELTAAMMDEIYDEFMKLKSGKNTAHDFLNQIYQ